MARWGADNARVSDGVNQALSFFGGARRGAQPQPAAVDPLVAQPLVQPQAVVAETPLATPAAPVVEPMVTEPAPGLQGFAPTANAAVPTEFGPPVAVEETIAHVPQQVVTVQGQPTVVNVVRPAPVVNLVNADGTPVVAAAAGQPVTVQGFAPEAAAAPVADGAAQGGRLKRLLLGGIDHDRLAANLQRATGGLAQAAGAGAPAIPAGATVMVNTAQGAVEVPFHQLPPELQQQALQQGLVRAPAAAAPVAPAVVAPVAAPAADTAVAAGGRRMGLGDKLFQRLGIPAPGDVMPQVPATVAPVVDAPVADAGTAAGQVTVAGEKAGDRLLRRLGVSLPGVPAPPVAPVAAPVVEAPVVAAAAPGEKLGDRLLRQWGMRVPGERAAAEVVAEAPAAAGNPLARLGETLGFSAERLRGGQAAAAVETATERTVPDIAGGIGRVMGQLRGAAAPAVEATERTAPKTLTELAELAGKLRIKP